MTISVNGKMIGWAVNLLEYTLSRPEMTDYHYINPHVIRLPSDGI
jgi:hypothetical protein